MCGSTCFGRLYLHHQELTTALTASCFTYCHKSYYKFTYKLSLKFGLNSLSLRVLLNQMAAIVLCSFHLLFMYTGCPRRNVPDFGGMFLMLKYTDITENTYIQSWTFTDIMAREMCGLLAVPRTVPVKLKSYPYTAHVRPWEWNAVNVAIAM
jgi:hypothetical protein